MVSTIKRSAWLYLAATICGFVLMLGFSAGSASAAGPRLDLEAEGFGTHVSLGGEAVYKVLVENLGSTPTSGQVSVVATLPPGTEWLEDENWAWDCAEESPTVLKCVLSVGNLFTFEEAIGAHGEAAPLEIFATVGPGFGASALTTTFAVSGGGSPSDETKTVSTVSSEPVGFGIDFFGGRLVDSSGAPERQAGGHPDMSTKFVFSSHLLGDRAPFASPVRTAGNLRTVDVELPPGFVGNPTAVPTCTPEAVAGSGAQAECPPESQVGLAVVTQNGLVSTVTKPIYNVVPGPGEAARFAFNENRVITNLVGKVGPSGDYRITAHVGNISQTLGVVSTQVTLWGVPASPANTPMRAAFGNWGVVGASSSAPPVPFLSAPTACTGEPLTTSAKVEAWGSGTVHTASFDSDYQGQPFVNEGCEDLPFEPSLSAVPSAKKAGAPTGLSVELRSPSNLDNPAGLASAHLRNARVTFPAGMTVNATSAEGQVGCSPAQIELKEDSPAQCPPGSKLGTVEVETPLLEEPLRGALYLATQGSNPFDSLIALYISIADPDSGVNLKIPGKVTPDPNTGQLTVTFTDAPQLPFEAMRMELKGGNRAPLVLPSSCGTHTTRAEFASWARPGETLVSESSFTVHQGCDAGTKFSPRLEAGTANPGAGEYSPFTLRLTRPENDQNVARIEASLPAGLLAKLAGVGVCPDAQAASGACPASSQVGSATVGAGAGAEPLYVPQPGKATTAVYLAGPYKGAPYSLVVMAPAQAGAFDLGVVAVRNALYIDPQTAAVTVKSDPLPQILQGIPIAYRDIRVDVDRKGFTLNPTSCEGKTIAATITSAQGMSANPSARFRARGCGDLEFGPRLALGFSGAPNRRGGFPALKATLKMPKGGANIARAQVTLPKTQLLEQGHIRTICTRVQYAAGNCPKASIYGYARAWSPLLDKPLQGPVYLRSSNNPLPDLVASLDGQIHIDLAGRIDSVNARIRNTFALVPDAPVSKFVLTMQGGKKGLLVNNTNLCKAEPRAEVKFDGQNGKVSDSTPLVKVAGCGKKKGK